MQVSVRCVSRYLKLNYKKIQTMCHVFMIHILRTLSCVCISFDTASQLRGHMPFVACQTLR